MCHKTLHFSTHTNDKRHAYTKYCLHFSRFKWRNPSVFCETKTNSGYIIPQVGARVRKIMLALKVCLHSLYKYNLKSFYMAG